jgi:hypothetical protein
VETEYAIRNDGSHWEVIKGIGKVLPNVGISVLPGAFVVKSVAGVIHVGIEKERKVNSCAQNRHRYKNQQN